jgi:predicted naringenin-chalcone synthase
MSYITAVGTATPSHKIPQSSIANFMIKAMDLDSLHTRKLQAIFKSSGIATRYSVLEDYGKLNDFTFFSNDGDPKKFPTTRDRQTVYQQHALPLALQAIHHLNENDFSTVTHLITVSCTGLYAPGLDIELVQKLNLNTSVQRTNIMFMGCYAAFNALKVADAFCKENANAKVLVVCIELCSLHFQKEVNEDNILANALFADGAAAVMVSAKPSNGVQLKLKAFHNDLATDGNQAMAWLVGDYGFEMRLSAYVPAIIKQGIKNLTDALLKKIEFQFSDIQHFAIHPGGKKILEVIESELDITREKNTSAYHVLQNYGNMSSATVLFVLQHCWKSFTNKNHGEHVLSFAFGPGLTMESMLLEIEMV